MTDSKDPVLTGETYSYEIIITNRGPLGAANVMLGVTRPTPVTFTQVITLFGSCQLVGGGASCDFGTIPAGESRTVTIAALGTQTGTFATALAVHGFVEDAFGRPTNVPTNETAVEPTTFVAPSADLQVSITDSPDPVVLGSGQIAYTVTVTNLGPQPATNVVFDGLVAGPGGADSATSAQGTCNAQSATVRCALGTIAAEGSTTIVVRSLPSATGTVTLSGFATATEDDPDRNNNSTHQPTAVVAPQITPSINVGVTNAQVLSGQDPGFFADVDTGGGATGVTLDMTLSAGVLRQVDPPASGGWTCAAVVNNAVQCVAATVAAAQQQRFSILSDPPSAATPQTLTLTAILTTQTPAFTVQDFVNSMFTPSPLMAVFKTDNADPIELRPGNALVYTVQITNIGSAPATNARLLDTLPLSMVFVSAHPAALNCTPGRTVICPLGTIRPGDPATVVQIEVQPTQIGTFENIAVVNQSEAAALPGEDRETTQVVLPPIVSLAISPGSSTLRASQNQQLTLTATLADGTQLDYTQFANWSSSNDAFATVSSGFGAAGNVTAMAPGTVTITAMIPGTQLSATATVRVNQPPVASFIYACRDLSCTFNGTASSDADGTITNTHWDFGDGNTRTGVFEPVHVYGAPGTYTVTLTVTDNDGATHSTSQQVTVFTADFTTTPTQSDPLTIDFAATTSGGVGPFTFAWDFGDGSAAGAGATVSHTYAAPGTYTVTLTVTDQGNSNSTVIVTKQVIVGSPAAGAAACAATLDGTPGGGNGFTVRGLDASLQVLNSFGVTLPAGEFAHSTHREGDLLFVLTTEFPIVGPPIHRIRVYRIGSDCTPTELLDTTVTVEPSRCELIMKGGQFFLYLGVNGSGVEVFQYDPNANMLTHLPAARFAAGVGAFEGLRAHPSGNFLSVLADGLIRIYQIAADGTATEATGSPYALPVPPLVTAFNRAGQFLCWADFGIMACAAFDTVTGILSLGTQTTTFLPGGGLYLDTATLANNLSLVVGSNPINTIASVVLNVVLNHAPGSPYPVAAVAPKLFVMPNGEIRVAFINPMLSRIEFYQVDNLSGQTNLVPLGFFPVGPGISDSWAFWVR